MNTKIKPTGAEETAAHTPGPWRATLHANGLVKVESNQRVICDGFRGEEANARLIAAAPDLLAALKAVLAQTGDESMEEQDAVFASAAAAIAKAEGSAE